MNQNVNGLYHSITAVEHKYSRVEVNEAQRIYNDLLNEPKTAKLFSDEKLLNIISILKTLFHERVHYFQFHGTSIGYLLRVVEICRIKFLVGRIRNLHEKTLLAAQSLLPIPFVRAHKFRGDAAIQKSISGVLNRNSLFNAALGEFCSSDDTSTTALEFFSKMGIIEDFLEKFCSVLQLPEGYWQFLTNHRNPVNYKPAVLPSVGDQPVSLISIWETQAHWLSNAFIVGLIEKLGDNISPSLRKVIEMQSCARPEIYNAAYVYVISKYPDPMSYWLFLFAADIACMTPFAPGYNEYCSGLGMDDLLPARRFCRIIESYNKFNIPEDPFNGYKPFADEVCAHFGWPTVDEVAKVGTSMSDLALLGANPTIYAKACELRIKNPSIFCTTILSSQQVLLEKTLGVPFHIYQGNAFIVDAKTITESMGYFISSAVDAILNTGDMSRLRELLTWPIFHGTREFIASDTCFGFDPFDVKAFKVIETEQ